MPNVMVALPNIGGVLCSTPQSLADAHYKMPCSNAAKTGLIKALPLHDTIRYERCQDTKPVEICRGAPNSGTDLSR